MSLTLIQERNLRQAWHQGHSRAFLARRYSVSEKTIDNFWRSEKAAGRLPAGVPRPFFAQQTALPAPCVVLKEEFTREARELDRVIERSERNWESHESSNVRATAESLAALRAAHPELDRPDAQTVPLDVAALDAGKNFFRPSATWLRDCQRRWTPAWLIARHRQATRLISEKAHA